MLTGQEYQEYQEQKCCKTLLIYHVIMACALLKMLFWSFLVAVDLMNDENLLDWCPEFVKINDFIKIKKEMPHLCIVSPTCNEAYNSAFQAFHSWCSVLISLTQHYDEN